MAAVTMWPGLFHAWAQFGKKPEPTKANNDASDQRVTSNSNRLSEVKDVPLAHPSPPFASRPLLPPAPPTTVVLSCYPSTSVGVVGKPVKASPPRNRLR